MTMPDLAMHARQSESAVGQDLAMAWHMDDALPATWEALNAGDITPGHARMLHQVTYRVDDEITRQVEATVLPKAIARRWTPSQLADAARTEVMRLDPEGARKRAEAAKKSADVKMRGDEDEMAFLNAYGDAWTTRQLMELNRRADAKQRAGDERSVGERRIGALAEAVLGEDVTVEPGDVHPGSAAEASTETPAQESAAPAAPAPKRPSRATALLLVDLPTLLGGPGPAYLEGCGSITAMTARRIAAGDIKFRRLVFDPLAGRPVDLSVNTHDLTAEMRRWVDARDRHCLFLGCRRLAIYCDADHAIEHPVGETSCENCGLLCRKHHNLKTEKWWHLRRNDDDSVDWKSPIGFEWHVPASTYEEFIGNGDPPDPWAPESESCGSDPDPPYDDDDVPWPWLPPPPADKRDVEYDKVAAFLHGSKEWVVVA